MIKDQIIQALTSKDYAMSYAYDIQANTIFLTITKPKDKTILLAKIIVHNLEMPEIDIALGDKGRKIKGYFSSQSLEDGLSYLNHLRQDLEFIAIHMHNVHVKVYKVAGIKISEKLARSDKGALEFYALRSLARSPLGSHFMQVGRRELW